MENLNDAVTEVSQLLVDQHVEISSLLEQNKELQQKVATLEEELERCKAEILALSNLPSIKHRFFGWF